MPLNIGDPAPNFTLKDVITGQTHSLSDYNGQITFLVFSGPSWCPPCQFEAPVLEELHQVFKNKVCKPKTQFLMVSVSETEQSFKNAVQAFGLTFPCLFDPNNNVWQQYQVLGVPTIYVINEEQKVCNLHVGAGGSADALFDDLRAMLLNCGACDKDMKVDMSRWVAAVSILFGVTQDGGGLVITPGGKPIPIDPWGPLMRMSPEMKNVLMNLAISQMSRSVKDVKTATEMEQLALKSAEASMRKLVAGAGMKPAELKATISPVKK